MSSTRQIKDNEWKLDPKMRFEVVGDFTSDDPLKVIETLIEEKQHAFLDEKASLIGDFYKREEFEKERSARKLLIELVKEYTKISFKNTQKTLSTGGIERYNEYLLLDKIHKMLRDEVEKAINFLFGFKVNGKRLIKRKGESARHYLMRYLFLSHLNERYGVRKFEEEFSKLKEVLRAFSNGTVDKKEWEKVAKRADLYVTLRNGEKYWVEIETKRGKWEKKFKNLKSMLKYYPDLFDKVVFVSSDLPYVVLDAGLKAAMKSSFPRKKIDFYFIDFENGNIYHAVNPRIVKTQYGDQLIDFIADYDLKIKIKISDPNARSQLNKIREKVILPLMRMDVDEEKVREDAEEYRRIISFWRRRIRKHYFSEKDLTFKKEALSKIKNNYPFLYK